MKLNKILSKKTNVGSTVEQEEEMDAAGGQRRMNFQNTRSAMNPVSLRYLAELEKQAQDSMDVTHHDAINTTQTFTTIGSVYTTSRDDDTGADQHAQMCSLPLCGLLG